MDAVNLSILCVVHAGRLKEASPSYSSVYRSADNIMKLCSKAAEICHKRMFSEVVNDSPNSSTLTGSFLRYVP